VIARYADEVNGVPIPNFMSPLHAQVPGDFRLTMKRRCVRRRPVSLATAIDRGPARVRKDHLPSINLSRSRLSRHPTTAC
jgi:hypothetical protein